MGRRRIVRSQDHRRLRHQRYVAVPVVAHRCTRHRNATSVHRSNEPGAIDGITYVSEAVAVAIANTLKVKPTSVYSPELVTGAELDKAKAEYQSNMCRLLDSPSVSAPEDDEIKVDEEDRDDGEGY